MAFAALSTENDRKVTLKGPKDGIESAEDELVKLFTSLATTRPATTRPVKRRVSDVAACDGPSYCWAFQKDEETSSNLEIEEYPYRLQQSGRAVETASQNEAWIKEFCEDDIDKVMDYLLETPSELPIKLKLAFGKLCFKLRTRSENSTIAWRELQKLRNYHDFSTRWSNFCKRTSASIVALMDNLEMWMENGVEPKQLLSVHAVDSEGRNFDLKYHLIEGQWKLHKAYKKRHVHGTYDIIFDNDISFRLRAFTREEMSMEASAEIQRHFDISIPEDGGFFSTEVYLYKTAPIGMHIYSFDVKSTVHVDVNGLRFGIYYLDQSQEEFRLECRLSNAEMMKLDVKDNKAQVLLAKVLQML